MAAHLPSTPPSSNASPVEDPFTGPVAYLFYILLYIVHTFDPSYFSGVWGSRTNGNGASSSLGTIMVRPGPSVYGLPL